MNTLLIGYDLNTTGQNYDKLIEGIKALGLWWHHLDSTWLVKTDLKPSQVRDSLKKLIDSNDELLVLDVTGANWATAGMAERANAWLKNNL